MILSSPGVSISERNDTNTIPSVSSSSAALVGFSNKGTLARTLITSQQQFINEYGKPVLGQYFHYSALAYLAKGNQLYCQRVAPTALYAGLRVVASTSGGTSTALGVGTSTAAYTVSSALPTLFEVFSKDPGTWGNSISIIIANTNITKNTFDIQVWYTNPTTSVTTMVEKYTVSRLHQLDGFGKQQFLESVINGYSSYIVVYDNGDGTTTLPKTNSSAISLGGGSNGTAATDAEVAAAWTANFSNPDDVDVRILINGGYSGVATQLAMKTIAEARTDCFAIWDIPYANVASTTTMTNWESGTQNFNTTYGAVYGPWIKDADNYNGVLVELPPSGYVAGAYAYNDSVGQVWDAPAGTTRGQLPVIGCAGMSTSYPNSILQQADRDVLVASQINPIQNFRGQGIVLFEQKTQATTLSDLSSINVRRSLIVIEKALSISLRSFLFERNNDTTRLRVRSTIEEYLSRLAALGAFDQTFDKGYSVICDTTNNSPAQIQNLELHVDIYIKPILAVEKLYATAILTPEGATLTSFSSGQLL
jgi:phage tail sheath protein FI